MEGLLFVVLIIIGAIYAFVTGCRAFRRGSRYHGYHRHTLYFLGLNLCEPLINIVLIPLFLGSISEPSLGPVVASAPMIILLIPGLGIFFRDRVYRNLSLRILLLGILRWVIVVAIFYTVWSEPTGAMALFVGLLLLGTGLLWFSAIWGTGLLPEALAEPNVTHTEYESLA
jgi:hypothetical protein